MTSGDCSLLIAFLHSVVSLLLALNIFNNSFDEFFLFFSKEHNSIYLLLCNPSRVWSNFVVVIYKPPYKRQWRWQPIGNGGANQGGQEEKKTEKGCQRISHSHLTVTNWEPFLFFLLSSVAVIFSLYNNKVWCSMASL